MPAIHENGADRVESLSSPRGNKVELPFCWACKPALRRIRDAFDATHNVSSALSIYLALCEIASDEESSRFITTQAYIAGKAGLKSVRTAGPILNVLQEIGLLQIDVPPLRAPATYTLLSVRQLLPSVRQQEKTASLPTSEEAQKNSSCPSSFFSSGSAKQKNGEEADAPVDAIALPKKKGPKLFLSEINAALKRIAQEKAEILDRESIHSHRHRGPDGKLNPESSARMKQLVGQEIKLKQKLDEAIAES